MKSYQFNVCFDDGHSVLSWNYGKNREEAFANLAKDISTADYLTGLQSITFVQDGCEVSPNKD